MPYKFNPLTNKLDFYGDPAVEARVLSLENLIFKIAYYVEITALSGTISFPTGSSLIANQWPGGKDAETCNIPGGTGTPPDFEATEYTATLDANGSYTVSGLASNPAAIIFYININLKDFNNLNTNNIIELAELSTADLEKGTIQGQLATWDVASGKWKYNSNLIIDSSLLTVLANVRAKYDGTHYVSLEKSSSGGVVNGVGGGGFQISSFGDSYLKGGNFGIGTANPSNKFEVDGDTLITGNSSSQGLAQNRKLCKHVPATSLGLKLIIPFISQGTLTSTTVCRITGHSAAFNNIFPKSFTLDFGIGHLTSLSYLEILQGSGNYASAAINGMNIEITFTSAYTGATANGVFITLEYMTNNVDYSVDVPAITMD